jgi:hypothetical protein
MIFSENRHPLFRIMLWFVCEAGLFRRANGERSRCQADGREKSSRVGDECFGNENFSFIDRPVGYIINISLMEAILPFRRPSPTASEV